MTERSFVRQIDELNISSCSRLGTRCMMSVKWVCAYLCACRLVVPVLRTSICVLDLCHDLQTLFLDVSNAESQRRVLAVETHFHVPSGPVPVR